MALPWPRRAVHVLMIALTLAASLATPTPVTDTNRVSIIVPVYRRYHNIKQTVDKLAGHPAVGEVIVCHGDEAVWQAVEGRHVRNLKQWEWRVDHPERYGAAARFWAAQFAEHELIMFVDDDLLPSSWLIWSLREVALQNGDGIYGTVHSGRLCNPQRGYKVPNRSAPYNIVLTNLAMTTRAVNEAFMTDFLQHYAATLAATRGNGEDIFFNANLARRFGRRPTVITPPACSTKGEAYEDVGPKEWEWRGIEYWGLDEGDGYSHTDGHSRIRSEICRTLGVFFKEERRKPSLPCPLFWPPRWPGEGRERSLRPPSSRPRTSYAEMIGSFAKERRLLPSSGVGGGVKGGLPKRPDPVEGELVVRGGVRGSALMSRLRGRRENSV